MFFTSINKGAYLFGGLYILQAVLLIVFGVWKDKLSFGYKNDVYGYTGMLFVFYALIIYPILGHLLGHQYPYSPTFGLPCPTTIFTFGIFLLALKKFSVPLLIIPLLWSLLGFSAALNLHVYEDFGLLIAGIVGSVMLAMKNRRLSTS